MGTRVHFEQTFVILVVVFKRVNEIQEKCPVMVVPAFNLSSEETEAGALCEFQASQSYSECLS